jgi:hypothetical protein
MHQMPGQVDRPRQLFLEHPRNEYNAVNTGAEPAVVAVTFFNVPHGGSSRIEQTNPGNC